MEDTIEGVREDSEIDLDYEFDAVQFFDFTRPESHVEAQEAERWFESVGSYAPSPITVRLKWKKDIFVGSAEASPKSKDGKNLKSISCVSDVDMLDQVSELDKNKEGAASCTDMAEDTQEGKTKYVAKSSKPRSSTLMKPTASHLAKLHQATEAYSSKNMERFQKPLVKIERRAQNLHGFESESTKRQKIEAGYLLKVAHLKHQTLLLHKVPKKARPIEAKTAHSRLKATIPKEPDLETAHRARRQRNNLKSDKQAKSDTCTFKARPLNRKIFDAPILALHKKSMPQLPEFQVFHFKTSERAMQHSSANASNERNPVSTSQIGTTGSGRPKSEDAIKQASPEISHKIKVSPPHKKDSKFPTERRLSRNPPIELFSKLSLKSELKSNTISQPKPCLTIKGLKENIPGSFQQETRRNGIKHNQCGSRLRIPKTGPLSNLNRSLDIC